MTRRNTPNRFGPIFESDMPGTQVERERRAAGGHTYYGGAKKCRRCKKPRSTRGGTNKNNVFICQECSNATAV